MIFLSLVVSLRQIAKASKVFQPFFYYALLPGIPRRSNLTDLLSRVPWILLATQGAPFCHSL